jgi:hypothetical protein
MLIDMIAATKVAGKNVICMNAIVLLLSASSRLDAWSRRAMVPLI